MSVVTRWFASAALAAGLGLGGLALPAPAQAQDDLTRALVDIADVVIRGGTPYYRHGDYGYNDRLYTQYDRYGRPVYYRNVYRTVPRYGASYYRSGPPYGKAHGYYRHGPGSRGKCNKHGKCRVEYYDPRYDRNRYSYRDRDDDRYWDGRRWRDDD